MRQIPFNREILKSRLSYIEDSVKSLPPHLLGKNKIVPLNFAELEIK